MTTLTIGKLHGMQQIADPDEDSGYQGGSEGRWQASYAEALS